MSGSDPNLVDLPVLESLKKDPSFGNLMSHGFGGLNQYGKVMNTVNTFKQHLSMPQPQNFYDHLNTLSGLKLSSRRTPMNLKEALLEKLAAKGNSGGVTVDQTDVEFVAKVAERISQDFVKKAGAESLMSMLRSAGEKGSRFAGGIGSAMLPALQVGSMATVGALGLGAIYDRINNAMKSSAAYDQMFEEFPELQQAPREQIDKYWGVLEDFAPVLTKNPLVAGQFISNMVNYGMKGVDHATANMLLDIQGKSRNAAGLGDALSLVKDIAKQSFQDTASPDQISFADDRHNASQVADRGFLDRILGGMNTFANV